jgi:hypothetical protein
LVVNMSDDQLFELVNSKGLSLEDTEALFNYVKWHGVDEFLFRVEFDNLMVVYPINGTNVELAFPLENVEVESLTYDPSGLVTLEEFMKTFEI